MSAGAVRQGRVFVEIGADPKGFLNGVAIVNRQIAGLGNAMQSLGAQIGGVGAAIVAPIGAASFALQNLGGFLDDIQKQVGSGAGIDQLVSEAGRLGVVIDRDTAQAAIDLRKAVVDAAAAAKGMAITLGSILSPALTAVARSSAEFSARVSQFMRDNPDLVKLIAAAGIAAVALGTALNVAGRVVDAMSGGLSGLLGPVANIVKYFGLISINVVRLAAAFVMATPVVTAVGVAVGVLGVALLRASGLFDSVASAISGAFSSALASVQKVLGDLLNIAKTTVSGIFDAIVAGNFKLAFEIGMTGARLALLRGTRELMGGVDAFVTSVQDEFDSTFTFSSMTFRQFFQNGLSFFSQFGAILVGIFDNVTNAIGKAFDDVIFGAQKAYVDAKRFFGLITEDEAKSRRSGIEAKQAGNAAERGAARPGIEGRVAENEAKIKERQDQLTAQFDKDLADQQQRARDRQGRNASRREDRELEEAAAEANLSFLRKRAKEAADAVRNAGGGDEPPPGFAAVRSPAEVFGTFSAFAAGGLGQGSKLERLAEQQRDFLGQIARNTAQGGRVGP